MDELSGFVQTLKRYMPNDDSLSIEQSRLIIKEINEFLYTSYPDIGITDALGETINYFSDFHKYWEQHYAEIINAEIVYASCEKVADALHEVFLRTNGTAFSSIYDTLGLTKEDICRVRFLTANQDFRGSRSFKFFADLYEADKSIFDERFISADPESFIKALGITGLSQSDKRVQYAKKIADFLISIDSTPYQMIDKYNHDIFALRNAIIDISGGGYGNKKTDMFIRDMVVLDVWSDINGFDKIDVASDVNTIKVALRTGILKTSIPLVSSFLDIFCHQYGYIDDMNANAWRTVWKIWAEKYPTETIKSPCLLDYFVYSVVGRQFCKESLSLFKCDEKEHTFKWHSSQNRTCQICYSNNRNRVSAKLIGKIMPCMDNDGYIAISKTQYVQGLSDDIKMDRCPFAEICSNHGNQYLQPPKSISIYGQTGWTTAYSEKGNGGGGLMA